MSDYDHIGDKAERSARFEYLMDQYLDKKATEEEKEEMRRMVESGFGSRFKERFDEAIASDLGEGDMPPDSRQEILVNIFERGTKPERSTSVWKWTIAAAVLFMAASAGWFLLTDVENTPGRIATNQAKAIESSVFTGKQFVKLPDGSTVILNENSTLTHQASFNKEVREVTLTGEGYFDIQHDPTRPFVVSTGKVKTTVLGTAFNISAYPEQKEVKVTVTRGKVKVSNEEKTLGVITLDQQIAVNILTDEFVKSELKAEEVVEWKSSYLILDNLSLEAAAVLLEEKYNVKIVFAREELKHCRIRATFLNGESINKILSVISLLLNGKYEKLTDGTVVIDGKGCE